MLQYHIHCTGCKIDLVAKTPEEVATAALEHLRTVHASVVFPAPALHMFHIYQFSSFDYPTQDEPLKAGIPSEALAPIGQEQPSVSLTLPKPSDLKF